MNEFLKNIILTKQWEYLLKNKLETENIEYNLDDP